eukprot:9473776-Pyramimonas_sp.AAC.1
MMIINSSSSARGGLQVALVALELVALAGRGADDMADEERDHINDDDDDCDDGCAKKNDDVDL